jgi:putative membrane protein
VKLIKTTNMKSRILSLATVCLLSLGAFAQQSESSYEARADMRIGKLRVSEFQEINAKGTQMVNAITPTSAPLSSADVALFNQVAMGGMRQLAISQAVLGKTNNEDVRMLAQSEVEEQTTLSAKLKEFAAAKGLTIPTTPDPMVTELVQRINNASADEVNALYLQEGGIRGHELLQTTMKTVKSNANDDGMKALAVATLPVIKTHLKVSKKEQKEMK